MMNATNGSVRISGSGSAGGGIYEDVKISGSGKITSDVECKEFHISGSGKAEGNVKAGEFRTSGSSKVNGSLEAEDIRISGSSDIDGDVKGETIKVSGSASFEKNLNGKEIEVSGSIRVGESVRGENVRISGGITIKGDCEVENFEARGAFQIGGLLNADNIEIYVGGYCNAREIGGERIEVRELGSAGIWSKIISIFTIHGAVLKSDLIEGDDIYLEYTTAKVVRGNNITIGKCCSIDTVEYKGKLDIIDDGRVANEVKVN
jgi:cytoskeletal protein CcmA (bactofilin family)